MLPGFIGGLLHSSTRLFVASNGMAVSHHHDVLVLMIVGPSNEQLGEASLDGTVGVCAFANVGDAVDVLLQGSAVGVHVTKLSHEDDVVAVVQSSRVPGQDTVASVTHVLEFINELFGEIFDLVDIKVSR